MHADTLHHPENQMKYFISILSITLLAGCSSISPYTQKSPIDDGLKACGLGYSTEAGGAFKAAYQFAENTKGLDFEAKMKEGLETQITSLAKTEKFTEKLNSKDLVGLIQSTQECVIKFTEAYRPKTRSELISDCMTDLQKRLSGNGSTTRVVSVKNWIVKNDHPRSTDENPIVTAYVDSFSSYGGDETIVQCKSKNYKYYDLEAAPK